MDGTFSSCPKIFDQVYTIHSIKYEECKSTQSLSSILVHLIHVAFPCVFRLLPKKWKTTYQFLIRELKSIADQMKLEFTPKIVMSDFETALVSAVKTEVNVSFPKTSWHVSLPLLFSSAPQHICRAISTSHRRFTGTYSISD